MKPEPSPNTFDIPPALRAEIETAAEQENRPATGVLRDLVERGVAERRERQAHAARERQRAIDLGLHDPADDQPMSEEYRRCIQEKIVQGLKSLGEGKGTDGEALFAEMYAELDELERQGR
jgi:hypothetical protein